MTVENTYSRFSGGVFSFRRRKRKIRMMRKRKEEMTRKMRRRKKAMEKRVVNDY